MPDSLMTETPTVAPPVAADRSPELDKLATALAAAQSEIEGAVKDKSNPAFRSKYADLGAVWDAIREPLTKNKLSVVQFPRRTPTGVAVKTMLLHASGQWISGELEIPCTKQDAHGVGSATTYARRFSLSAVVGVAPMDDDGNGAAQGFKPAAGTAGGGGEFRQERRSGSMKQFAPEAEADGLIDRDRQKGTLATPPTDPAVAKRMEWAKAAINALRSMNKTAATDWWAGEKKRIAVIEEALPNVYDRLLDAYNEALERGEAA